MRFLDIVMKEFRIDVPDKGDTMGIPRNRMPQVKTADYPEYFKYLKDNGVDFKKIEGVKAAQLKPIQGEFSKQGVEKQLNKILNNLEDGGKPLIASSDDYIIDGHHRWLAAKNTRSSVTVFKADIPMRELLELTLKFPKVYFKDIYTEGYKLQLERDADMYVLHITDSETGKRTEVRGKSGYESGNYDANDKLHQLLDRIGKASNISDLMNGEVVGINPKHPDGANAKAATDVAFNESITETFDNPYPYKWDTQDQEHWVAKADTPAGLMLVMFEWEKSDSSWEIEFAVNGSMDKSGKGDEFRIFATVVAVIKDWIAKVDLSNTKIITFSADKGPGDSRTKLYSRFAKQMARQLGWKLDVANVDFAQADYFKLHNPNGQENFSDKAFNEAAGVGRVVKGVNTTVDVGPDEIIKQVKKFGNDVDRDGFPKKHLR